MFNIGSTEKAQHCKPFLVFKNTSPQSPLPWAVISCGDSESLLTGLLLVSLDLSNPFSRAGVGEIFPQRAR